MSSHDDTPPGLDLGSFVPLDAEEFHDAYATFVQRVEGMLPRDPVFLTEYQDARSGEMKPLQIPRWRARPTPRASASPMRPSGSASCAGCKW